MDGLPVTSLPHSPTTGNLRQLRPGGRSIKVNLRREAATRSRSTCTAVIPSSDRPTARVSANAVPAESSSRSTYSPGSIPGGKRKLIRRNFGGRCILFSECLASSPRVGEKEAKFTVIGSGSTRSGVWVATGGCGSARCCCEMLGSPCPLV